MKTIKIIFFTSVILFLFPVGVYAQVKTNLTVFPAVQDLKVNAGENTRTQIQFKNGSDRLLTGSIKVADFIVVDKKGTTELIEDSDQKPKYSASSWIQPSNSLISIPKNEIATIDLDISVPTDLTSCGYYALVYLQPNAPGTDNPGVTNTINSKIGGLINFIVENKKCLENVSVSRLDGPGFSEYGPVNITFDLLNLGDIHESPKGSVTMTNIFGQYVDQQTIKELRIFPEKAKEYQSALGQKWLLGRYKISVLASYGVSNPLTTEKSVYVWIFPWKVTLLVILTILVLVLLSINLFKNINNRQSRPGKEVI